MSCGYHGQVKSSGFRASLSTTIKKIKVKTEVSNIPITTCQVEDFFKYGGEMPSRYNGEVMKTLVTQTSRKKYLISNLVFKSKRIQFIAVDGNSLTKEQIYDPDYVINKVNNDSFKPIFFQTDCQLSNNDKACIDAYSGSLFYCMFLHEVLGQVGMINEDMVFLSVVNVNISNAFWNGLYMTYGNGNEEVNPLTTLKIVGHEAAHGVIEFMGGLDYHGEAGAINESLSDILGVCLEKYYKSKTARVNGFWHIGEDITEGGIRSMSEPNIHEQPACYNGRFWVNPQNYNDNGGVHTNSGVGNYIFYLLVAGGSGLSEFGRKFDIQKKFDIFNLTKLIFISLKGGNGFMRFSSRCTYKDFADILRHNIELSCPTFLETFDEVMRVSNLCIHDTQEEELIEEFIEHDQIQPFLTSVISPIIKLLELKKDVILTDGCRYDNEQLIIPSDEHVEIPMKSINKFDKASIVINVYNPYNPLYVQVYDSSKIIWTEFVILPHLYQKMNKDMISISQKLPENPKRQDFVLYVGAGAGKGVGMVGKIQLRI